MRIKVGFDATTPTPHVGHLVPLLLAWHYVKSRSEACRVAQQWAVRIDGQVVSSATLPLRLVRRERIMKIGKRYYLRLIGSGRDPPMIWR